MLRYQLLSLVPFSCRLWPDFHPLALALWDAVRLQPREGHGNPGTAPFRKSSAQLPVNKLPLHRAQQARAAEPALHTGGEDPPTTVIKI